MGHPLRCRARDANGDRVLTVWRENEAGMKPYALANLVPSYNAASPAEIATMAPDGAWIAGHAYDQDQGWPVVWDDDAIEDTYGEPQLLSACAQAGPCNSPDYELDLYAQDDPGGIRRLPGVILSWDTADGIETLWVPWDESPSGFITVDEVLADYRLANDESVYYDGWVASSVDANSRLSTLVISVSAGARRWRCSSRTPASRSAIA